MHFDIENGAATSKTAPFSLYPYSHLISIIIWLFEIYIYLCSINKQNKEDKHEG